MGTLRVKKVGRPIYLKLVTLLSLERKQKKNTYRKMDKTQKYTLRTSDYLTFSRCLCKISENS